MNGTPHQGFHVGEDAYENYARQIDPAGEDIRGAGAKHLDPHADVDGDGFSALGQETGFSSAYASRMRGISERVARLGGQWQQMGDAARQTAVNYQVVEGDQGDIMRSIGKDLP
ncbi:hypothetical protein [Amycolatopsis sp. YIM 10]|uniref:hypothetical protein n=1 Tax=Amycolatopsis sp. YIM 10 TaxID=2653857 RepID=UPI001290864D|nr:hypothetical protein [Amycolatopsis sp. YIM 10]QFU86609.1 hypothetical protein YIM_06985 [Amycolatopsis sp. YIM 10]